MKRRSLEAIASEWGVSEKELVMKALEEHGNENAAATALGISRSSIVNAKQRFGLEITHKTIVKEGKR